MKKALFLLIFSFATMPALAMTRGDMFTNAGFGYQRPSVPGDQFYRGDLFRPQSFTRSNKDMFDRTKRTGNPGIEDLFSAHVDYIPDEPLFHWPRNSRYP